MQVLAPPKENIYLYERAAQNNMDIAGQIISVQLVF